MFLVMLILCFYNVFFSVYVIAKLIENDKDINTLYDNYSKVIEKSIKKGVGRRVC